MFQCGDIAPTQYCIPLLQKGARFMWWVMSCECDYLLWRNILRLQMNMSQYIMDQSSIIIIHCIIYSIMVNIITDTITLVLIKNLRVPLFFWWIFECTPSRQNADRQWNAYSTGDKWFLVHFQRPEQCPSTTDNFAPYACSLKGAGRNIMPETYCDFKVRVRIQDFIPSYDGLHSKVVLQLCWCIW